MSTNDQDKIKNLEERINKMESDISSIKDALSIETSSPLPRIKLNEVPKPISTPKPNIPRAKAPSTSGDNSKFFGFVAAICFLLAASYFIKYAIDTGWLTPLRQVGGAFLFGYTLIFTSFLIRARDQKYSSILAGTGIVIVYMSAFAGHMYYYLYNIYIGILLVNLISLVCIYLFYNFKENYYALAAILGTYAVPIAFSNGDVNMHQLALYFIAWGLAYSFISINLKNRLFIGIISYLGIFIFFSMTTSNAYRLNPGELSFIIGFQAVQFFLFLMATILYSLKIDNPLSTNEAWSLFPALLLFYGTEYYLVNEIAPNAAPWLAILFGFLTTAAYLVAQKSLPDKVFNSLPILATYLAIITVHAGYINLIPDAADPWFALGVIFFVIHFLVPLNKKGQYWPAILVISWIYTSEIVLSLVPNRIELSTILVNFSFAYALFLLGRSSEEENESNIENVSTLIYLLSFAELLFGEKHFSEFFLPHTVSDLTTSILWGITALLLLFYAKRIVSKCVATTSMLLFSVVAYKVIFMDLYSSDQGAKIISLVILGSLFYYAGYIYKNLKNN